MKKALEYILSAIVSVPDKVEIKEEEQDGILNFIRTVAPEDMGKVIGKNGKVIRAIRNVVKIPAIRDNKKVNITLSETSENPENAPSLS